MKTFDEAFLSIDAEMVALPFTLTLSAINSIMSSELGRRTAHKKAKRQMAALDAEYQFQRKRHENL